MSKQRIVRRVLLGLTAVAGAIVVVSTVGFGIADAWRGTVDGVFGTQSYVIDTDESAIKFKSDYATADEMMAAAKAHAIKQGEEGTVIMQNENAALPIASAKKIALFGTAAWKPFMQSAGDLKAGNSDYINLDGAFEANGYSLDTTMKSIYDEITSDVTITTRFGNTTTTYNKGYVTSPGDMAEYQIREVPPSKFTESGYGSAAADWKTKIEKSNTVGVVVFARGAGESNTYSVDGAKDFAGNSLSQSPLRLSPDELELVDAAKETCDKVIVLLNTGNTMEIEDIVKGGAHEVDAIGYMGVINDYQCQGIVNVLTGKANATGALPETYLKFNKSAPAVQNFGGDEFADAQIAESSDNTGHPDPRYPTTNIANGTTMSFPSAGAKNYSGSEYIVEAEGIYVGYNYFETRYYDSIMNPSSNASAAKGSSSGSAWKYSDEVVFPFGYGLSYYDYSQKITGINVDKKYEGNVVATIEVENKSDTKGLFLAELYTHTPYTQFDKDNKIEKSAVQFLSSKKVELEGHAKANVEISVPTKYLASYKYVDGGAYVLDQGEYLFTAANGSHEAVNNFLKKEGKSVLDGMDGEAKGEVVSWNHASIDEATFSTDHDTLIKNVAPNADMNYWLPGSVTYLSRTDWDGTYPINYNTTAFKIGDSAKKEEWIKEIQGRQYEISTTGPEVKNVDDTDNGYKFKPEQIGVEQLNNINDPYWQELVDQVGVNHAVGQTIHGGSQTDTVDVLENPIVGQNEGVNGTKGADVENPDYHYNINSQTLLGSSFNPDLAYEWGLIEGNGAIHIQKYQVWGTGLTQRRTPYNGRNYEYISEDAMLTNRIGYGILKGCKEKGLINGPKHMGFNDQEHNRSGIGAFMNEQKMRETDLRGFQGGLEDAGGQAVMIAFNRIGSTNASHHTGMLQEILRKEWGFTGIVSTDLAGKPYFAGESCLMASITQIAEFGGNNSYMNKDNDHTKGDSAWPYLSVDTCKNDEKLIAQARQNMKYQLYTFANSAVMNISTRKVIPSWEVAINSIAVTSAIVGGLCLAGYAILAVFGLLTKEN